MLHRSIPAAVVTTFVLSGCAVGLDRHPLTPEQAGALQSRSAPARADAVQRMTSTLVRLDIDAPPAVVWDRLGVRYGDVHEWSGPIEDSAFEHGSQRGGPGAARSCKLGDSAPIGKGKSFGETILVWDSARRYYAAGVDDGFYPLKRVVQEYWVEETPTGSRVTTQFHFALSFPMGRGKGLVKKLRPQLVTSLLGLKHLVETGNAQQAQDADFLAGAYADVYASNGTQP